MVEVKDVVFRYEGAGEPALDGVSLTLGPGERVVLLGSNGSGKSTLGRLLNGGLRATAGTVSVDGRTDPRELVRLVGYVRQDPRNQIVSAVVSDEVAFGPRNLGLPREEVLARVDGALAPCGISSLRDRMTAELSGGQQQLVALAGVLAMRPRYLVLDEVGAHLDEDSRERVRDVVGRLVEGGTGVLEMAHAAQDVLGATRVVVLGGGRLTWSGSPEELFCSDEALGALGWRGDLVVETLRSAALGGCELGGRPDVAALAPHVPGEGAGYSDRLCTSPRLGPLSLSEVRVMYGGTCALDGTSLSGAGLTLVVGASGSGKTTAARVLAGVLEPDEGRAELGGAPVRAGRVGLAFQRPEDQLFCDTVLDDIAYGPRARGGSPEEAERLARGAARELGVAEELLGRSPFELSGGQMRRAALAGVVAARPGAYVFDEPTAGLDAPSRRRLCELARSLAEGGAPVIVITHDAGDWLGVADDVYFLAAGRVVAHESAGRVSRDPAPFREAGLTAPLAVRLRAASDGSSGAGPRRAGAGAVGGQDA